MPTTRLPSTGRLFFLKLPVDSAAVFKGKVLILMVKTEKELKKSKKGGGGVKEGEIWQS